MCVNMFHECVKYLVCLGSSHSMVIMIFVSFSFNCYTFVCIIIK